MTAYIPIDKSLLEDIDREARFLIKMARMYGKTEPECNAVEVVLDRLTTVIRGAEHIPDGGDEMTDTGYTLRQLNDALRRCPPPPDSYLEEAYDARTEIGDSEMP